MDEAIQNEPGQEVLDHVQEQEITKVESLSTDEALGIRKRALQLKLEDSLTDTIHIAVDTIKDRFENGDYKFNPRTGEATRVPISVKDAAATLAIIYDKRALIRGEATSIKTESKATLHSLKQSFEQFAIQLKEKEVRTVDEQ